MSDFLSCYFSWKQWSKVRLQRSFKYWLASGILLLAVTLLPGQPALATGIRDIPELTSPQSTWVIDQADVLSFLNKGALEKFLDKLAKETGQEVRMVTIRRLDYGETPETLTNQIFEKWFPTPEAQANQVLVLLDSQTNGTAIRTGEQVKAVLPEAVANSVAAETMRVPMSKGSYNQALLDASDRLGAVLAGQPDPGPPEVKEINIEATYKTAEETDTQGATVWVIGLLLAATLIPMVTYYLLYQGQG